MLILCLHVHTWMVFLIDKRLPRWNIFYLLKLRKMLKRFSFTKVFDLQNSARTNFYKNFFLRMILFGQTVNLLSRHKQFEEKKLAVLDRMELQLNRAGITDTKFTKTRFELGH